MDDAERIPINIGYEVASPADATAQPRDPRTSVKEDGTLVIDILAPQPCAPEPSTGGDIVVCAEVPKGQSQPLPPPPSASLNEKTGRALHAQIGPLELGSIDRGDSTRAFGLRVRFLAQSWSCNHRSRRVRPASRTKEGGHPRPIPTSRAGKSRMYLQPCRPWKSGQREHVDRRATGASTVEDADLHELALLLELG